MDIDEQKELVTRVLAGDLAAFERVFLEFQGQVRAFFAVRLKEPHDADDLAQEVFLTAYRNLAKFDFSRPLGGWLHGVTQTNPEYTADIPACPPVRAPM